MCEIDKRTVKRAFCHSQLMPRKDKLQRLQDRPANDKVYPCTPLASWPWPKGAREPMNRCLVPTNNHPGGSDPSVPSLWNTAETLAGGKRKLTVVDKILCKGSSTVPNKSKAQSAMVKEKKEVVIESQTPSHITASQEWDPEDEANDRGRGCTPE